MLILLTGIYMFSTIDRAVVSVVAEPLKAEFGLSDAALGALSGLAYSVSFAIAALPMGWVADRFDRRKLLAGLVAAWSVCTLSCAGAGSYVVLFAARLGVGATEAGNVPTALSMIADGFEAKRRNTALGVFYAGTAIATFVVFLVGGFLLHEFGWRSVFLIAGAPGLLLGMLFFFTVRDPPRGGREGGAVQPKLLDTLMVFRRERALRYAVLGNALSTAVMFTLLVWTSSFMVRVHDLSPPVAATWTAFGLGLAMPLGALISGPIADRVSQGDPRRLARIPATGTFLAMFMGLAMSMAPNAIGALAALVGVSLLAGLFVGPSYGLILAVTPPEVRGAIVSLAKLISILVQGVLPLATGMLSDAIGGPESIRPAIAATVAIFAVSAWSFWMASRTAAPPLQAAPAPAPV